MQGTEFAAPGHENRLGANASTAPQASADAMYAEADPAAPLGTGAGAGTPTSSGGVPTEASVTLPKPDSSVETAPSDESSLLDDAALDVSPASDTAALAVVAVADGAPGPSSCDVDGDGYLATGAPCFGNDCCDIDSDVHPGQTQYFRSPSQCGSYDYDCDGIATPEYAVASCQWVGLGCTGDGFVDITACGVTAAFTVCTATSALTCTADVGSLIQACR
jgi:hypothetical protein